MTVNKLFYIGNVTVPSTWIALIIAFIFSYIAIRLKFGKQHANRFGDAVFYLIVIWKLSVIITDFKIGIDLPLAIIYFNGGIFGFIGGLIFVACWTWHSWMKDRIDKDGLVALFMGAVSSQAVFQVMMVFLKEGSMIARAGTAILFIGLLVFIWKDVHVSGNHIVPLSLLFMAVHVFVAVIQPKGLWNPQLLVTILIGLFFTMLFSKVRTFEQINGGNHVE
ncbi:hypothetical protein MHZ92_09640 [Sporosarcina sp. ACRSL]|uniref:hypothetical protein n=1 Tax=Sporosarcina sp. ACRSL TaxID=2918215 RepID=UPI001EF40B82|nr:hypothetical protein [Sporosarcina sp. ACRSL]MCG7344397.1 hypothetical protein [Sporosarcina sp. ACRSL]